MRAFYTATIVGNKAGIYINPVKNEAYIKPTECSNYKEVNFEGVTHLVIYRTKQGLMHIAQANGYTKSRGLFYNTYEYKA